MELDREKVYGSTSMRTRSVFGLILNARLEVLVVSNFLPLRSSKQAGAFVVNLQSLPETGRIAPKWSFRRVVRDGNSRGQFSGTSGKFGAIWCLGRTASKRRF